MRQSSRLIRWRRSAAGVILLAALGFPLRGANGAEDVGHAAQPAAGADNHGHGAAEHDAAGHDVAGHGAAGHGDDHPDFNQPPLVPKLPLLVFSLILFVAFVFVARSMVWQPLIGALDAREARVNQALAAAEQARLDAAKLLAAHDAKMGETHEQVREIVAAARKEGEALKMQIVAEAEAEAAALRDRALREIRAARDEALSSLNAAIDRQVDLATEQVIGHRLN